MSDEPIFDAVIRHGTRDLSAVVCWLDLRGLDWCIIGGHGVNSYAPPALYDARLDVAVDVDPENLVLLLTDFADDGFRVDTHDRARVAQVIRPGDGHRLRVTIRHGEQFRAMPARASRRVILGRELLTASLPDVTAALLEQRADPRASVREQTEAEMHLFRLTEAYPAQMDDLLPGDLRARAKADRERVLAHVGEADGWGEGFAF